jgi:N-[(2S)-2-amino-2-carboxyethyl]-L-glutamate dehydrogenase
MLYLNEDHIRKVGIDWNETIKVIEHTVELLKNNDYAQPIKPYLRYGDPKNRIIAMPAYAGGEINKSGIKWIASFPDNINNDIPRANSVTVLNNAKTGVVESIVNTPYVSIIRTASVTGFLIKQFQKVRDMKHINVGIIGFGPIGQNHLKMCEAIIGDRVDNYYLYDIRPVIDGQRVQTKCHAKVNVVFGWQDVYDNADIFMCCTVADEPYIDHKPKKGALILDVSLRDFKEDTYQFYKDCIVVDDWKEVCREKTTIDDWNRVYGLDEKDVYTMVDVLNGDVISKFTRDDNIMFCPMGMAVFDIAISTYFYNKALGAGIGVTVK